MAFNQGRLKDLGTLAVVVAFVQIVLSKWVYPFFGTTTQQLFGITPIEALASPTIGNQVLGFLSGIISFDFGNFAIWISVFIGTFVLLIAGYWVYEQRWAWKGKDVYQRLWSILLYGTAVLYIFLLVTQMGEVATLALPLIIGLGINYAIVAFVVVSLARNFKFLRI